MLSGATILASGNEADFDPRCGPDWGTRQPCRRMGRDWPHRKNGALLAPIRYRRTGARLGPATGEPPRLEAALPHRQQKIGWGRSRSERSDRGKIVAMVGAARGGVPESRSAQ